MHVPSYSQLQHIWAQVPPDYYYRLTPIQTIWHDWKWIIFTHLLKKHAVSPKKILDIGCAGGHMSGALSQLYPDAEIVGIDVYKSAIAEARKRYPRLTFIVADALKLPFSKSFFDLVICSETIEHVVAPDKLIFEMERVLRAGGFAVLEMDSGSVLFRIVWYVWTNLFRGKVWKEAHLFPFTAKELDAVVKTHSLLVVDKLFSHFGMAVTYLLKKQ